MHSQQHLEVRAIRSLGEDGWRLVRQAYGEPHRAYHNLSHISAVFETLDPHLTGNPNGFAIELAVWFHDIVYEVTPYAYMFNEERSAEVLQMFAADHRLPMPSVALAMVFILATKEHKAPVYLRGESKEACELFLDADLAILAAPKEEFEAYEVAVLTEYRQKPTRPSATFKAARRYALKQLAERDPLFLSSQLRHLETQAKTNLSELCARYDKT